jgi:hypothetical protein
MVGVENKDNFKGTSAQMKALLKYCHLNQFEVYCLAKPWKNIFL